MDIGLLSDNKVFVIYRREAKDTLSYKMPTLFQELHFTAMGKAILAYLSKSEIDDYIARANFAKKTENTLTKKRDILKDLNITRSRGYALNREEYIPGQLVIAAPIFNLQTDKVIGAVSFEFISVQISIEKVESTYSEVVCKLANEMSNALS